MKKAAIFIFLFLGAIFAKELEFELEITDFYDPLSNKSGAAQKEEFIKNIAIEGAYVKDTTEFYWSNGGGGCGRDVMFCINLPGPRFDERSGTTYKKASNIVIKDGKIRFKLPDSKFTWGDLRDIHINDLFSIGVDYEYYVDFRLAPHANGSGTLVNGKIVDFSRKNGDIAIYFKSPLSYKLSFVEKDKLTPVITAVEYEEHYPNQSIKEVFKIPHDAIRIEEYGYEGDDAASPYKALKERSVKGWHVSYNAFDITSMYAVTRYGSNNWKDEIKEYRYAKDGRLYKIEGRAYSTLIGGVDYSVYFYPDGSSKRDFDAFPEGIKIEQFEKEMQTKYQEDKEGIKAFKNSIAYMKHILNASDKELQKEFDTYKKSVILLKVRE